MININGIIGNERGEYSLVRLIQDVKLQPETDPIHLMINSPGGDGELSFDMHDYLRGIGRPVVTECSGQCSSAASILFLSGDRRIAGSPIMIHNPWTQIKGDANDLEMASKWMSDFEKRCEKFYAEKTGLDDKTISDLMKNETYMSPSESVALNFATESRQPAMAFFKINTNNKKQKTMEEKGKSPNRLVAAASAFMEALIGDEPKTKMMDLMTATGDTISIDRTDGTPQVGDSATPDGTYVMPDGSTIVILNGVITDIQTAQSQVDETEQLKAENAQLKQQLESALANARTQDDLAQLNAIKIAGGTEWLAKQCSSYKPQARASKTAVKPETIEAKDRLAEKLAFAKEKKLQMLNKE